MEISACTPILLSPIFVLMKKNSITILLASIFTVSVTISAYAGRLKESNQFTAGVRYHTEHAVFDEVPYDDGDLSFLIAYEYHEPSAYWQLALGYAPDASNGDDIDYVFTPEINIIIKDSIWRAGIGILTSYVGDDEEEWSDMYWHLMAGVKLPVFGFPVQAFTYYTFEDFGEIVDEWEFEDMEYGIMVRLPF